MTQFQDARLTFQEMLKNNLQLVQDSWQLRGRTEGTDRGREQGLQVLEIKKKRSDAQSRPQRGDSSILD